MRFPRFRRRRPEPQITVTTPIFRAKAHTFEEAVALVAAAPSPAQPKEEKKPMSPDQRRGRILRSATKRQARTAGELAVRSALAAADGSGRAIAGDLAELVRSGQLIRHGRSGHYSYTRA